jgi:hypothetical protein
VADTPDGGVLTLAAGDDYRLSTSLRITRAITIDGNGARVSAADGAGIAGAVIRVEAPGSVRLSNLIVDANVDRRGADYGIWITGGSGHRIEKVTIRDSAQACVLLEDASGTIAGNTLERCGRDLTIAQGTAANNHGIMVAALNREVRRIVLTGNRIRGAYRKGITTYARSPGSLSDIVISNNAVWDCGLGGIYVANAPGATPQRRITLSSNTVERSYVAYQIDDAVGITMTGNKAWDTRDRLGGPGGQGLVLSGVTDALVKSMDVNRSGDAGVLVRRSTRVRLVAPIVTDANWGNHPFAPGIHLSDTRNSRVEDLSVVDLRRNALTTHGVVENDGSKANSVTVRRIDGVARRVLLRAP